MEALVHHAAAPEAGGRTRLTDQLGVFGSYTISAVATGGEPARYVLADELRDDEEAYLHQDAATVGTISASKGLEFRTIHPCVQVCAQRCCERQARR